MRGQQADSSAGCCSGSSSGGSCPVPGPSESACCCHGPSPLSIKGTAWEIQVGVAQGLAPLWNRDSRSSCVYCSALAHPWPSKSAASQSLSAGNFGTIHLLLLATCIFRFIHADTGIYMQIHAIHADTCKILHVCIWYVWVIYVYVYFCNTYSIHTHIKGGSIHMWYVCVCIVCMCFHFLCISCAYRAYVVHIVCIFCSQIC